MGVRPELIAKALAFTIRHPDIWQMFCDYADQLIEAGHMRNSADNIMHQIRWDLRLKKDPRARLLNNDYTAGFSRIWLSQHPHYPDFFERRKTDGRMWKPPPQMELSL